jgi:DNA-cytosine methyltransferase
MKHGSLFSGIGGFDLAAEWMGWENSFHCEWNEFGQRVLKHYWPKAKSYEDITKVDFRPHRGNIDILTGGFPCQPFSAAGKRKGTDDSRHLWPEMCRAIREIEPTYVVGENVRGLLNWNEGLVFDQVCADLETCGYEVQPFLLPAAGVNAPHRRDRIWFVARRITPTTMERAEDPKEMRKRAKEKGYCNGTKYNSLMSQIVYGDFLPTPIAGDWKGQKRKDGTASMLSGKASLGMLPTPTTSCANHGTKASRKDGKTRESELNHWATINRDENKATGKTSQLNPRFVGEMMGFPPNWTELPFQNGETNP